TAASTPTAQGLATWWSQVQPHWSRLTADAAAVKADMKDAAFPQATRDAGSALAALQQLQADPAAPDPAVNGPWQAALGDLVQAYQAYQAAFTGGSGTHVDDGNGDTDTAIAALASANAVMGPLTGTTIVLTG
ncbi:MAG: hypothetical protein ACRDZR_18595, partial [Acidimicrobiales bacterium]